MKQNGPSIEGRGKDGGMHYVRLMAYLQELVRDHGRKKAAAILGVDPRTLDAGLDKRVLSRRMRAALENALRAGVGSDANDRGSHADEMGDRADALEARLDGLRESMRELGREIGGRLEAVEARLRARGTGEGADGSVP